MSRFVYVVSEGERGEGHSPIAVATTLAQARRFVLDRHDTEVAKAGSGQWMVSANGVDEVWVERLPLIGGVS